MSEGKISFDNNQGLWVVEDEHGNIWTVVCDDGPNNNAILQREDSQKYYGAEWSASGPIGTLYPRRDGDTWDDPSGGQYTFTAMGGWQYAEAVAEEE